MKRSCKSAVIAANELRYHFKSFAVFFLISAILLSAMVAIFTITVQVPDELNDYIMKSGDGTISILEIETEKIQDVQKLPIKVAFYSYPFVWSTAIGLPDDWLPSGTAEDGTVFYTFSNGAVAYWLPDDKDIHCGRINENLLQGRAIEESDNQSLGIWLSQQAADHLGVSCGDTISFCAESEMAKPVECKIQGIYQQEIAMYTYYVSLPLYESSIDTVKTINMTVCPQNIRDYGNILTELKRNDITSFYSEEFINAINSFIVTLYAVTLFLCILEISMVISMAKGYVYKRMRFFAIYTALGIKKSDIAKIVCFVMQGVFTAAFVLSLFIAPLITQNVYDVIEEMYYNLLMETNIYNIYTLLLFVFSSVLLWITCTVWLRRFKTDSIADLVRREGE